MKKQLLYIVGILIVLHVGLINTINAASFTWTGTTSSSWSVAGNWSGGGGGTPGSGDNITMNSNAPNNLVLDQNRTVTNFTINGDTLDLGTYTFTTTGVTYFNGGLVNNGNLSISGTLCHFGGATIDARIEANCGYYHLNGGVFNKPTILVSSGSASTSGTGNCTFADSLSITNNGSYYFTMSSTHGNTYNGPVTIVNNATHEVYLSTSDTSYFNDLIINNTSSGGVVLGNLGGVSYLDSGNTISIGSSGFSNNYLTLKNFYQIGYAPQTLTLTGTAILNLINANFDADLTVTSPGILLKNSTFNGVTTITRNGSSGNFHCDGNNFFNSTFILDNAGSSGRVRMANTIADLYGGSTTFNSTGGQDVQIAYSGVNQFLDDITLNSNKVVFNSGNGTVVLSGGRNQTLLGNYNYSFRKLSLSKSFSEVTTNSTISVDDTLLLNLGNLITSSTALLTMKAGSKAIGASEASFVSGPIKKIGNTEFEFPVGKENVYRPLKISAPTTSTHAFTAEYFNYGQPFGENLDTTLAYIDDCNYWNLTRNVGSSEVFVTLSWESGACPVKDTSYLKIASWYDDNWNDLGHGTISGNYTTGKMTTTTTNSSFEHFIFAYDSNIVKTIQPDEYITADGFVENIGQLLGTDSVAHPEILYYGSAFNSNLFLADSVFSYVFSSTDSVYAIDSIAKHCVIDSVLRFDMKLNGINRSVDVTATDTSQGYKNYFLGYLDTSYTHALTYQEIKYNEIYNGIDLLFHNNDEFRFALDSSGLTGSIEIYYQGVDSIKVDGEGFLNIFTKLGNKKYGINGFEKVSGEWAGIDVSFQKTDSIIRFSLGAATRNVPLIISVGPWQFPFPPQVINPHNKLKWCTSYTTSGTFSNDNFNDVYIDPADNIYVVGVTYNMNFPVINNLQLSIGGFGGSDISIVKFYPDRSRHFSTWYGGSSNDFGNAITVDYGSNIIFTGTTQSVDFPLCQTCATPQSIGGGNSYDVILVKLTSDGSTKLMSTYFGLTQNDMGYGIAVDKVNSIYLVGGTAGGIPTPTSQPANSFYSDFTANANGNIVSNSHDGFIAKFSSTNTLVWSTHYGSDGLPTGNPKDELISSIVFDEDGNNFYVMGFTTCDKVQPCTAPCTTDVSPDFPITGSNYIYDTPDDYDYFIVKFNSALQIIWSTLWGGSSDDFFGELGPGAYPSRALAINPLNDDLIVTGSTDSPDIDVLDIGGSSYFNNGQPGGFVATFDSNDNLKWCSRIGGRGRSVSSNDLGQFIIAGSTDIDYMDVLESNLGAYYQPLINNLSVNNGQTDGFLLKFNSSYVLNHATFIGGAQNDFINSCAMQKSNGSNIICVGLTRSPAFPWRDYIPNYTGDYSFGDPGLNTSNFDATPFVLNLYNVSTPSRFAGNDEQNSNIVSIENVNIVYPNPFSEKVNVQSDFEILEINVFDLSGKKLRNYQIPNDYAFELDLSDFYNGIYFLDIKTKESSNQFKIIKIK